MIIDGEKWACDACVRGHRVSNCQHQDRPLQHINKKGRPVSQCQHCRAMRKSRASHVKCDCGEKTHKCMHLKTTMDGHKDSCCCNHGGRCTCSHKKEHPQLDTVPESDSDRELNAAGRGSKGTSRTRRRANTTSSDGILSFDANGHHKPTHKPTKASQKCGPYQLQRGNSLHSTSSLGNHSPDSFAQASSCGDSQGSRSPDENSINGGGFTQARRKSRSEATSPLMTGSSFSQLNGQLPPLDLTRIKYSAYMPNTVEFFSSISEHDPPLFSAGVDCNAAVDWSIYEFASKPTDFAPSSYSQPQSYGGFDFNGPDQLPTMTTTTSNSGEVSEAEDFLPSALEDFDNSFHNGNGFGLSAMPANFLAGTDFSGVDFDDYKLKASGKYLATQSSLVDEPGLLGSTAGFPGYNLEEDSAFWMGNDYGLPDGLPAFTESPVETNMAAYWDGQ